MRKNQRQEVRLFVHEKTMVKGNRCRKKVVWKQTEPDVKHRNPLSEAFCDACEKHINISREKDERWWKKLHGGENKRLSCEKRG